MINTTYVNNKMLNDFKGHIYDITAQKGTSVLAPTWKLQMQFKRKQIDWKTFKEQYIALVQERLANPQLYEEFMKIVKESQNGNVMLLCYCRNENLCHRSIAKRLIEDAIKKEEKND